MEPQAELAKMHLLNAEDELGMSEMLLNKQEHDYWAAALHAHQCAEETLMGLLTFHNINAYETNGVEDLLALSVPVLPELEQFREQVGTLTVYNTEPDNPAQYYDVTQRDAERSIEIARKIFESVSALLFDL